jgi:hypothetical protein
MKIYSKLFMLIFIFSIYEIKPAAKAKDNATNSFNSLLQERIENLVIFNDVEERAWEYDIPLFETKGHKEESIFDVFGFSLMSSFANLQTVVCTKFLFKSYIFLSQIWPDLLHLNIKSFQAKYENRVNNLSDKELKSIMEAAQQIDLICSDNLNNNKNIKISNLLSNLPVKEDSLYNCFLFYKGYQSFKQENKYHIYEINDFFLLFFPKEKLSNASLIFNKNKNSRQVSIFKNFNQFCEIYFGLNIPLATPFMYSENNFSVVLPKGAKDNFIGEYLIGGLQKLFVNNYLWKIRREKESLPPYLLPKFNIVLGGHGYLEEFLMELTPQQIKKVLSFFNTHVWTKTLMLESCYIGGVNFKNIFGHSHEMLNQFTENLNYTILFEGSFYTATSFFTIHNNWNNYIKNINNSFYSTIFEALSLGEADYLKIIEKLNSLLLSEDQISNYISIKFPNTGWIMANDYQKNVFNITKVRVVTTYPDTSIYIPDSKNIVLMNTNIIPLSIHINMTHRPEKNQCKFLPVFYTDQNYAIDLLRVTDIVVNPANRDQSIANILYDLFNIKIKLSEPINIFIKKAVIERYQIKNILIKLQTKEIFFESLKNPGMLVKGQEEKGKINIERVVTDQNYLKEVDKMAKRLDASTEFLSNINKAFLTKLETSLEEKKISKLNPYAKRFSKLNPVAKPFVSKIQPIQM